jgi:hypothetical protein
MITISDPEVESGLTAAFLVVLAAIGLWWSIENSIDIWKASESKSWPLVVAQVVTSTTEKGCGRGRTHHPTIKYTYMVEGGTYSGDRIRFGSPICVGESSAIEVVDRYPVGSKVNVHVNPRNSFEAVLLPGELGTRTWVSAVGSALFALLGVMLALRSLRTKNAA